MRKAFTAGSIIAVMALLALISFSFTGTAAYAQTGTATPETTGTAETGATSAATDTAATTAPATTGTADTTGTATTSTTATTTAPGSLPNTAEGDPVAPNYMLPLLLAIVAGAVLFYSLASRKDVER